MKGQMNACVNIHGRRRPNHDVIVVGQLAAASRKHGKAGIVEKLAYAHEAQRRRDKMEDEAAKAVFTRTSNEGGICPTRIRRVLLCNAEENEGRRRLFTRELELDKWQNEFWMTLLSTLSSRTS